MCVACAKFESLVMLRRWKHMNQTWVDNPAFIVHFAGCGTCSGFHPERLGDCDVEYVKTFAESFQHLREHAQALGLAPGRDSVARPALLPSAQHELSTRRAE